MEDVLSERILQDLEAVFKRRIFESFEVVPVEHCLQNKCPVLQDENHLAIESWCTKNLYKYAYTNLLKWRTGKRKAESATVFEWTRAIILLCPEVELAWNIRKELIEKETLELRNELNFNALVLSWKPKSSHAFAHRRWIISELLKALRCQTLPEELLEHELMVCKKAASSYCQNYYAWTHRIWVIEKTAEPQDKVAVELKSTEEWMSYNVSDHCCFHYRQYLFSQWIQNSLGLKSGTPCNISEPKECDARQKIFSSLLQELGYNSELVLRFEGHETLWYHRRFLIWTLSRLDSGTTELTVKRAKFDLQQRIVSEVEFVRCLDMTESGSWQHILLERHSRWLSSILATNLPD